MDVTIRRAVPDDIPHCGRILYEAFYDIATRHGFWHFGRFSGDYRRQFGQSPSQTPQRDARAAPLRAASSPARRPSTSAGAPAAPA